jgi:hypothetical protein
VGNQQRSGEARAVSGWTHIKLERATEAYASRQQDIFTPEADEEDCILLAKSANIPKILLRHRLSSATTSAALQIVLGGTAALHVHRAWGAVLF